MSNLMPLRLQAEAGDPRAQFILAHASILGLDVPRAPDEALRLLKLACEKNYPDALLLRGALSLMGLFVPRNYDEAFAYLKRAAAAGDPRAQAQASVLGDGKGGFDLAPWQAKPEVTQRFAAPRLFTFKNFIPKPACDWLIARSRDKLKPAPTWNDVTGGLKNDSYRSGRLAPLAMLSTDLVSHMINLRIAGATGTPLLNQEPTSILHYAVGQEYKPHFDFISGDNLSALADDMKRMGQRVGTFLIALNAGYAGGETAFPKLDWRFKGEPGDALFFWNLTAAGAPEPKSLHAGLPVTEGEKWLLSKWIRADQTPLWWPNKPAAPR